MTWFKVDDAFYRSGKVRRLGNERVAAVGLWTLCGNWSGDNLTDGFVPWEVIEDWDPGRVIAKKLIAAKLWAPASIDDEEGVQFHDWGDWQPTRTDVMTRRKADAERRARWREARKAAQMSRRDAPRDETRDETRDPSRDASQLNLKEPAQQEVSRRDPTVSSRGASRVGSALPDPTRPDPTRSSLREERKKSGEPPAKIHAGTIVAAWTDAFEANGAKPTAGMRGQVGRLAGELLGAGNDPDKVLAAAQAAGTKGYSTIDRELGALAGRRLKAVGDEDWRKYSEQ